MLHSAGSTSVGSHMGRILVWAMAIMSLRAQASPISVTLMVRNPYALFYGTKDVATTFVGGDAGKSAADTYSLNLDASQYLYVVTVSDGAAEGPTMPAQGLLGQLENKDKGYKVYSNDLPWQVTSPRQAAAAPMAGRVTDLTLLTQEIARANTGENPSHGWTTPSIGPSNGDASSGPISSIDYDARWVWYEGHRGLNLTSTNAHQVDWLIFRIPVAASPSVSEPAMQSLVMCGLALAGLWAYRRWQ